jgi:hypothetical protein
MSVKCDASEEETKPIDNAEVARRSIVYQFITKIYYTTHPRRS